MATTERDYYELLGVARDASEAEIKKAFRALARELHPDVSDAPDADERFREVVEAYEVLSKSETRELYDRYGHAGLRSGGFQPGPLRLRQPLRSLLGVLRRRPARQPRVARARRRPRRVGRDRARRGGVGNDARGAVPGRRHVHALRRRRRRARQRGHDVPDVRRRGPAAARVAQRLRRVRATQACPTCGGSGRKIETPCTECHGAGRVRRGAPARGRRSRRASTTASASA